MKSYKARSVSGFTLVEILVVIAIIAVLASAGFVAGNAALLTAKKAEALSACTAVEKAANDYFTEYGSLPTDVTDADDQFDTTEADGVAFLEILVGLDTDNNPRKIKFLDVKEGNNDKGGIIYNTGATAVVGLYDPWGGPYHVKLDADFDQQLNVQPTAATSSRTLNGRRVAVWSDGADWEEVSEGKVTDDVTTW